MFDLDQAQRDAVGLNFVLNQLSCRSPYGAEEIRRFAPFGANDKAKLLECFDNMENILIFAKKHPDTFDELCNLLAHFNNIRGTTAKLENTALNQVELFEIKQFLLIFERFLSVFGKVDEQINLVRISFMPMTAALDILDPQGARIAPFSIENSFSPALIVIRQEKGKIEALLRQETNQHRRGELLVMRTDIVAKEDAEESRVMAELSQELRRHVSVFCANMDNLGKLDVAIAKALLALKYSAVRPKIGGKRLVLKNMTNPMIAAILAENGRAFTKISISLDVGTTIITGANMGGKSVAMRTTVLNAMLCRLGFFVFAEEAKIPLFDGICLVSEDMQDMQLGLSSFAAEITRLDQIVKRSRDAFLLIALDELARATNPQEGAAIVRAVATYFADSGCICLMSTHYDGIARPGMKHYQVAGLSANVKNAAFIGDDMDYRLLEACPNTPPPRDTLRICSLLGLDEGVQALIDKEVLLKHD